MSPLRPAPGLTIEEQPQRLVVRMLLWGEARGEDALGKLAVMWVLHNRAMKRDTTLKAEALRPYQFSCFNHNDKNRSKLLKAYEIDPVQWAVCDAIATLQEVGRTIDPTHGATHYYVANMDNPPEWGRGHAEWDETAEIGHHVFGLTA